MAHYRRLFLLLLLAFTFIAALPVRAQAVSAAPAEDSTAAEPAKGAFPEEEEEQFGAWRLKTRVDADGQKNTDLYLRAEQSYKTKNGDKATPDLVLSCRRGSTIGYLDMIAPVGSLDDLTVDLWYTIEGAPAVREQWPFNMKQRYIAIPDANDFIRKLAGKKTLAFEIRPRGVPKISAYFVLNNLDEVFILMSERCYQ